MNEYKEIIEDDKIYIEIFVGALTDVYRIGKSCARKGIMAYSKPGSQHGNPFTSTGTLAIKKKDVLLWEKYKAEIMNQVYP